MAFVVSEMAGILALLEGSWKWFMAPKGVSETGNGVCTDREWFVGFTDSNGYSMEVDQHNCKDPNKQTFLLFLEIVLLSFGIQINLH